jgi:DnaA initiator-associating protein
VSPVTGYTRIADSFHRRIETIAGAVDVMAPGIESAAQLLTRAALEDRRIFVSGAGSDAALADFLARALREGDEAGPPLPALAVSCSGIPGPGLWRDLRALARDEDLLLCVDTDSGAPFARDCTEFTATRNLAAITMSETDTGAAAVTLTAPTRELRRELFLMACHCLQAEIRHLFLGD